MRSTRRRRTNRARRAFTLVELLVAGMAAFLVIGAVTIALFQSSRARTATKTRLAAFSRASATLDIVRRDVASVMRRADLFETRLLLYDDTFTTSAGEFDRDELLLFNTSLRPTRPNEYAGEGQEYESQFRIGEDETGIYVWQRRDPVPDEWSDAGGLATPIVGGVVGLKIEAYDGESWFDEWDSDLDGLPWAIRITVTANGVEASQDPYLDAEYFAVLRTQVPIDRIIPPPPPEPLEEEGAEGGEEDMAEDMGVDSAGGARGGGNEGFLGTGEGGRGGRPNTGSDKPSPPGRGSRGNRINGTSPSGRPLGSSSGGAR